MKHTIVLTLAALVIAANSFGSSNSVERYEPCAWERQIVAALLVLEASNQGTKGMQAVASVIANRGDRDSSRYMEIVKQPFAFSALNPATTGKTGSTGYAGLVRRASRDSGWPAALEIVDQLYDDTLRDITYGADHYTRRDSLPGWSHGMRATAVIGDHLFFAAR